MEWILALKQNNRVAKELYLKATAPRPFGYLMSDGSIDVKPGFEEEMQR